MSAGWNYGRIREKIVKDMGLEEETFVTPDEMRGYVNEGISHAESHIHTLRGDDDDYLLTEMNIELQPQQNLYPFPDNIYANKIRSFFALSSDNFKFEIRKIKHRAKFSTVDNDSYVTSPYHFYFYIIDNQIKIIPTPTNPVMTILSYKKKANIMENEESICDIPQFINYILFYTKHQIAIKEENPLRIAEFEKEKTLWERRMINTLTDQTDEDEDDIFEDHSLHLDQALTGITQLPVYTR